MTRPLAPVPPPRAVVDALAHVQGSTLSRQALLNSLFNEKSFDFGGMESPINPQTGLVAWLLHLRRAFKWPEDWDVKRMADFCAEPSNRVRAEREPALLR